MSCPPTEPEILRCVYDYRGSDAGELTLRAGDRVRLAGRARGVHWAEGALLSSAQPQRGIFPLSHCVPVTGAEGGAPAGAVVVVEDERGSQRVVCVEQFTAAADGEVDLRPGDVVCGVCAADNEWWSGTVEATGARGAFPSSHVVPVPSLLQPGEGPRGRRGAAALVLRLRQRSWMMATVVAYVVVLAALLSALLSCVGMAATALYDARLRAERAIASYAGAFVAWVACVVGLASASYAWTLLVSPYAAGSGTSQVRSIIGGARLPAEVLSPRTLVAKVVGVVLSAGSGLFVWLQGANVHIAACFAELLLRVPAFRSLRGSRSLRTQLVTTAVACTLSAQFGCPIAGVLYGVESAATYLESRNYWVCTTGAIISSIVGRVIYNFKNGEDVALRSFFAGVIPDKSIGTRDRAWEMSLLGSAVLIGLTSSLLAMAFLKMSQAAFEAKHRLTGKIPSRLMDYAFLFAVALVTGIVTFPGLFGNYLAGSEMDTIKDLLSPSLTNETSTANVVTLHAYDWDRWSIYASLLLLLFFRFTLTSVSATLPVPLGVYEPSLLIGMVYGRLIGELLSMAGSPVSAALCGLIGATSFAGSTHNTFSAALVVLELVGKMDMFLPLLVATTMSILMCRFARTQFITQQMSAALGVPQVWENFHLVSQNSQARQVMAGVVPLPRVATLNDIEQMRNRSVPVIPIVFSMDEPYLLGEMPADSLPAVPRASDMSPEAVDALLHKQIHLNYTPSACIAESMPLHEVYTLFAIMGLTHAFVVRSGKLVGMVTASMIKSALAEHDTIL
eukprot:m51a1_g9030 putative chloride channel type (789) ;mRNA; f:224029-226650